ncbi:putative effector 5 protein [Neofusicoccum parvum]|uniref:Effector 5 protein n=2 Tax=Neofusicoccum parvum TaxID=310453 RepID=A0ACB5S050_9PEZI|nr:putative candidate effector 5 protein [Neofusicoccum parvum UCRNP2]GME26182.1 putative effector 5 protein [Neofusicoccum parvum]GME35570.1 putative effector 5 protein [Neofusicoccum parvum]
MRFSSIALGALAATGAMASSRSHARLHREREARSEVDKRNILIDALDEAKLLTLGLIAIGKNALSSAEDQVWIGADGDYTNEYVNEGEDDVVLVVWGPAASWVNTNEPLITLTLPAGTNKTLSFASGASGAWAAVYNDTELVNGQISETWGEYTFGEWGCVDVSREVNMGGHNMTIDTGNCVSDMETCVFKCKDGAESCWLEYELVNCENGSQEGATYGTFDGAPTGGCGNMGSTAHVKTYLH